MDTYIEHNENDEQKIFLEAQEILFQDDLDQNQCPICLEDIYEKEGGNQQQSEGRQIEKIWESDFNITILCCHTINFMCLQKWGNPNNQKETDMEDKA